MVSQVEGIPGASKFGRLPVWAIALIIAGAIMVFVYIKKRKAASGGGSSAPATGEALYYDQGQEGVDGLPPGAIGDYLDSNPLDPAYPVGLTPNGIPGPVTNVQWTRLAFNQLIGQGNDPALVERALAKYIMGQPLTQAERAVVSLAQQAFGAPPEGLQIVPDAPAPPAQDVPTPSTPSPTPGAALPQTVTAPANTNLYNWAQQIESQYPGGGWSAGTVFDTIRNQGKLSWINDPSYAFGRVPVFTEPTTVRLY